MCGNDQRFTVRSCVLYLVCCLGVVSSNFEHGALADQVSLPASKDNTLYESATGSLSNGAGNTFFAGRNDNGLIRRAVIAFDVSSIPSGSTVNGVTLTLYMSRTRSQAENVSLYRASADWGEGTSHASGEEGGGAAPTTGDATWVHRFYPGTLWANPGGDFSATASATTSVGNQTNFYSWSSAAMAADVQAWVNNPASNFGWVIRGNEVNIKTTKRFESRQSIDPARRPVLTINYTPGGAPTGACCFANGSCSLLTQTECTSQGGTYQGDGTSCTPNPCPQPTGACCFGDGTCQILTQTQCAGQSGYYQGNGTGCTPNPCSGTQQAVLVSVKDNTLYEDAAGSLSNGAGIGFFAGANNSLLKRRGSVAFDLAAVPSGATILDARLRLYLGYTQATAAHDVTLHRLLADWGEGASNASGNESNGAPSTTGDATWIHRFYNTTLWSAAGGDFTPTASATTSVGTVAGIYYEWSSAGMVADVQEWVSDSATNFGWLLRGNETVAQSVRRFDTRESTDLTRPRLTVTYTLQQTLGACCFTDGSCSVAFESTCTSQGGSYQANGTNCTPNDCPQPTGACCFSNGTCQVSTATNCASQGGTYQGNGTSCTPNPCPQPTGACCFVNGTCQVLTEGDCTTQGGTYQGDGTSCTPDLCPIVLTPFVDPLPIPAIAQPVVGNPGGPAAYEMAMRQFQQQLHRDLPPTTVWGYGDGPTGGTYPGPTIVTTTNQPITVTWINDLRDAFGNLRTNHYLNVDMCPHGAVDQAKTVVHLHGGHVPPASDGYPESTFLPGSSATYVYANNQLPGTLWYHDHALGITRLNVYMGLAGGYLVTDADEQSLGLPSGEYEIPLVIQDRMFHSDGSLRYHDVWDEHFFGDKMLVNGKVWPYLNVKQGKYRFRVFNGCNSRTLTLGLSNGQAFQQIGTEGGLMAAPVALTQLTLGPGERADIIMDFAPHPAGREIVLTNSAPAPFPGTPGEGVIPNVMKFIVVGQTGHTAAVPAAPRPLTMLDENDAVLSRDVVLRKAADPCAGSMWLINELGFDTISEFPVRGTTEVWRFINRSGVSHPMHMHLVMFQVLDRQDFDMIDGQIVPVGVPVPPPSNEVGWKDTVMVHPNQITRVITRFDDYTGLYPYHCHILEHEDHEMMRQFQVIECLTDPDCDDGVSCTIDTCDEATDSCTHTPNHAACNDGLYCNGAETCDPVLGCRPGTPPNCDDGVACTVDACDEVTDSCTHAPNHAACNDGLYCNGTETCNPVLGCRPGTPPNCDDGVACTVDACDEVTDSCTHAPNHAACNDGLYCNGMETCDPLNGCQEGTPPCPDITCDEANDRCTDCLEDADCADGLYCNGIEWCDTASGVCQSGTPPDCGDSLPCTVDSCDLASDSCTHAPNHAACDDGLYCTGIEVCNPVNGCEPGTPPNCDDGVPCTIDACDAVADTCTHTPNHAACDDGLYCNGVEVCDPDNGCEPGTPPNCDDGVSCTIDTCDAVTDACIHAPTYVACDDGVYCNGIEMCDPDNGCEPGTPPNCDDGVPCTIDACNAGTDTCTHTPNHAACDDGQYCNGAETCDPVLGCRPGVPPNCDDGVSCTVDTCNEVTDSCTHTANHAACDDGLFCNGLETCDPVSGCQDGSFPCTAPAFPICDEAGQRCVECLVDVQCDDGLYCNGTETCDATTATCQPDFPVDCSAMDDACNVGACSEAAEGCEAQPANEGGACDDGDPCTINDICAAGDCGGAYEPDLYGDIWPQPYGDNVVDVDDLSCVVAGFGGIPPCDDLGDIEPCGGDGDVDVDDLLAIVNAFGGNPMCPDPCPAGRAVGLGPKVRGIGSRRPG